MKRFFAARPAWLRLPLALVWLAPLILLAPVYLTGQALFWGTPMFQFVPWWKYAWDTLLAGHLPLWNALVGMGAPLMANYQSALLYPPTWLYLLAYSLGGLSLMAWLQAPLLALHLALAGWGMRSLAARLGLNPLAQTLAGLAFGLSGYLVARAGFLSINAAVAWLPWVLYHLTPPAGQTRPAGRSLAWAAGCLALQLLAGHAQTTWYSVVLAGLWVLFWGLQPGVTAAWRDRGRSALAALLRLAGVGLLAASMAAAQLLPTAEYLSQTPRAAAVDFEYAMNYSFWPWHVLNLLAPGLFGSPVTGDYWGFAYYLEDAIYIGLLPLLLGLGWAFGRLRRHRNGARPEPAVNRWLALFLLLLFGLMLLLALGWNTPVYPWLYWYVPTFALFQAPARWMLLGVFALALLAGLGAHAWRRPQGRGLYWTRLGTMGALAISLGAGLTWIMLGDVSPSFIRATALMGLFGLGAAMFSLLAPPDETTPNQAPPPRAAVRIAALAGLEARLAQVVQRLSARLRPAGGGYPLGRWQAAVALFVTLDLLVAGWGLNPGQSLELYRRPADNLTQITQAANGGRLYWPEAQELRIKYTRFFRFDTFDPGQDWRDARAAMLPNVNLLDGVAVAGNYDPFVPQRYSRYLALLKQVSPEVEIDLLRRMDVSVLLREQRYQPHGITWAKIPDPAGHLSWAACVLSVDGPEQALAALATGAYPAPLWALVESDLPAEAAACLPHTIMAPADIRRLDDGRNPNALRAEVLAPQAGLLVRAETWYPGWRVWVDGQRADLLPVNGMFQGVWLSPGKHVVEFRYQPQPFYAGLGLSLLGLLVWVLWLRRTQPRS